MKLLTVRRRKWLIHRQRYSAKRRIKHHAPEFVTMAQPVGRSWRAKAAGHKRCMPEILCFNDNCGETLEALADIRRTIHLPMRGTRRGKDVSKHRNARPRQAGIYRTFEEIKLITPAAALVLAAEFERVRLVTKGTPTVVNVDKWSPSVVDSLWGIGFFDIVGFPTGITKPDLEYEYVLLPMKSGNTADGIAIAELIDNLKALYPAGHCNDAASDALVHLYGAMVEAVVNVCRHAYPSRAFYPYRHVDRWWMTGAVDRRERWMTAIIFDQGVTIPISLPDWQLYAGWQRRITSKLGLVPSPKDVKSDGDAIATAVEEAVSSTGDPHRGHGLAQMRDFVNQCSEGYLRIMSRCGEVIFRPGGERVIRTHDVSIGGTLIEWNVLL
ncbi:MAG: hypothetical protein ACLQBA_03735 [Candidatus Binataceae bacterium]